MKNVYGKDINNNTRLTRHYQDWEVELAKPNKDYITTDYFCPKRDISYDDCLNKLGQLEDNEEELGIDLLTLVRALTNGIYLKLDNDDLKELLFINQFRITRLHSREILLTFSDTQLKPRHFKDYGKTWALTMEELE